MSITLREHLLSRHVDLELHKPVIDEESYSATFYLYNLSGQLIGFQRYNPKFDKTKHNDETFGKYFTHADKSTLVVFGIESLGLSPNILFVTEGIFDAVRLTKFGYSAIAVLSNNPKKDLKNWLMMLNRKVVVVCDDDKAGKELAKFGHYSTSTKSPDLGDATDDEVWELIRNYDLSLKA